MNNFLSILIVVVMVATLAALTFGLISMARGGEFNAKQSNRFMRARVILQFAAIALLGLMFLFSTQ